MPVYNADRHLEESIRSILNQTFTDFEFIIVCDNPTEKTKMILNKYQKSDHRILIFFQERKGIIFARNLGCQFAKGEFIAVMDADDISDPERLKTQFQFLKENPDIGIVGSWVDIIDEKGRVIKKIQLPTSPNVIGWNLFFGNCIYHLTILMRSDILKELQYYTQAENGFPEDYDLWTRAFFLTKIINIPKSLAQYRRHKTNNSINVSAEIERLSNIVSYKMICRFEGTIPNSPLEQFALSPDKQIFSFDAKTNKKQEDLIETLYRLYVGRYFLTKSEDKEIRSQISLIFLKYSEEMFHYSIQKSFCLFIKSFHYSKSGIIRGLFLYLNREINGSVEIIFPREDPT